MVSAKAEVSKSKLIVVVMAHLKRIIFGLLGLPLNRPH
jgi:hypothetical protein